MNPSDNANAGPSKRPRADSIESLATGFSTGLEVVPTNPKRPFRPVTSGVTLPSASAGQTLRELEEGDEWAHVDNRTRRELYAWAWEDLLDGSVLVGNIKLPAGMKEVELRKTLYHKLSIHGRIDDLWLIPASSDNARRVLQVTFALYPSTVGAIRQDGNLRLTEESDPLTVRRQMHRPGISWFVTPRSTLADRQQEVKPHRATNEATDFRLIPELNQVAAPPDDSSFKHIPGKYFEDLGHDQYPPELPSFLNLSHRREIGMRENQRAVANEIAKMYKHELSEWDQDGYDAKIRSHLGDRLIRPEMTAKHEERSYTDNVFAWGDSYNDHQFAWAKDQFRHTIPDTPGQVYAGLEERLKTGPKQETLDYLGTTSSAPWFKTDKFNTLSGLERKTAGIPRDVLVLSGLAKVSEGSRWSRVDKTGALLQEGIEKARAEKAWKRQHPGQTDDPMFPRGYFWSPHRQVPPHDFENKSNLLLNRPLVRPGTAPPPLKQSDRPVTPPVAVSETVNADLLKFRAQHGSRKRK